MSKISIVLVILLLWSYLGIYQLPYYVWTFALSQNWFTDNGLILFKDIIYHHTQLPLFSLFGMSKILGNTPEMLRFSSFVLLNLFGLGIFLLGKKISEKIGKLAFAIFLLTFFPLFHNFNIEEMMSSLFSVYATYFYLRFWDKGSSIWAFLSGIFVVLAIMSKQSLGLIIIVYLLVFAWKIYEDIHSKRMYIKPAVKGLLYFTAGGVLTTLPFLIYYSINSSLLDFIYWNIIFNFTIYAKQSTPYAFGDGMIATGWLLFSIVPAIYLLITKKINKGFSFPLMFLTLCTIFLSTSLLPSFLTYKALPFYVYPLIIWAIFLSYLNRTAAKQLFILGLLLTIPSLKSFYIDYLPYNIFNGELTLDYAQPELKTVEWLKKNTAPKEKIMNLGHHYITTLASRLPQNKYVYLFPWLVYPFEKSTKEIIENPPRTVIIDWRTFNDFPVLYKWKFISYVKTNYKLAMKYDTYEIYSNK